MPPNEFQSFVHAALDKIRDALEERIQCSFKNSMEIAVIKAKIALVAGLVGFAAGTLASVIAAVVVYLLKK